MADLGLGWSANQVVMLAFSRTVQASVSQHDVCNDISLAFRICGST